MRLNQSGPGKTPGQEQKVKTGAVTGEMRKETAERKGPPREDKATHGAKPVQK